MEKIPANLQSFADEILKDADLASYYNPQSLLPLEQQKDKFRCEVLKIIEMKEVGERIHRGITSIFNAGLNLLSAEELEMIREDVEKMSSESLSSQEIEDRSLQELFEITDDSMKIWYQAAYQHYLDRHFEHARDVFTLLVMLNPLAPAYWLGLGGSEQMLEHYKDAVKAYEQGIEIDTDHAFLHLLTAQCHSLIGDHDTTQTYWIKAKQLIADQGKKGEWEELIKLHSSNFD